MLHIFDVRFLFTSSCLQKDACLTYVIYVCLRIVVSNTYSFVFLFCFSSPCVSYVARFFFLDFPFLIALSVFSNVYIQDKKLVFFNCKCNSKENQCVCYKIRKVYYFNGKCNTIHMLQDRTMVFLLVVRKIQKEISVYATKSEKGIFV